MATAQPRKISEGRAQDWISSVLNPIIDGLRREDGFLPTGPWHWNSRARKLEYLAPIHQLVPEIFRDNLDDFISKHPKLPKRFKEHDFELTELEKVIQSAHQKLLGDVGKSIRQQFNDVTAPTLYAKGVREPGDDDYEFQYFCSYIASNIAELPEHYSLARVFNDNFDLVTTAKRLVQPEQEQASEIGKRLKAISTDLREDLIVERTKLADRYGARIRPVDPDVRF